MEYVVLYLSEMRIVHDQSALHATLYGVSFEDARSILTLAVFVKVGAIFPENTPLAAADVVRKSLMIAASICVYTNSSLTIETLDLAAAAV